MLSTTAEIQAALDVLRDDDIPFPFLAAKSLLVTHGVTSSRVSLSSLWENEIGFEKVMVVFGRNLLWGCIKDWLADAREGLDLVSLKANKASLKVILPVKHKHLQRLLDEDFKGHPLETILYADDDGSVFKELGLFTVKFDSRQLRYTMHDRRTVLGNTLYGFSVGITSGIIGDPRQNGGTFVFRRKEENDKILDKTTAECKIECIFAHVDRVNADLVPIPVLLAAANLPADMYKHPTGTFRPYEE
jgi:hypothetical protein